MKPLTEEQREFVQAVLDGKTLQFMREDKSWRDFEEEETVLSWVVIYPSEVRIKPEPRKVTRELYATEANLWISRDLRGEEAERITVTYYPDEPDRDKRVVATLEDVE